MSTLFHERTFFYM